MKKTAGILFCLIAMLFAAGCAQPSGSEKAVVSESGEPEIRADDSAEEENQLRLYFDDTEIPVTWENNTAVEELAAEAANGEITVSMSMYGGWEQVGSLGRSYTRSDSQITANNGDIVLYSGNQIVVFYGSNSWSYTRLGKMDLPTDEVTELLSQGDITLTIRG